METLIAILAFLFTALGVFWSRKQDIRSSLEDGASAKIIYQKIINPENNYTKRLSDFLSYVDGVVEKNIPRTIGFCLMMSYIYGSLAYILTWGLFNPISLTEPHIQQVFSSERVLILHVIIFAGIACLAISSSRSDEFSCLLTNRFNIVTTASAFFVFNAVVIFGFKSVIISALSILITSLSLTQGNRTSCDHEFVMKNPLTLAAPSALSILGFTIVFLMASAQNDGNFDYSLFVLLTSILAVSFMSISLITTTIDPIDSIKDKYNVRPRRVSGKFRSLSVAILSHMTRPALYSCMYVQRNTTQFVATVSIAAGTTLILSRMGHDTLATATGTLLASMIFIGGARTIAGAGWYAFLGISALTVGVMLLNPNILYTTWSATLLFWLVFPIINASIDCVRWITSRWIGYRILECSGFTCTFLFFSDIFLSVSGLTLVAILLTLAAAAYNVLGIRYAGALFAPLPVHEALDSAFRAPLTDGLWLTLMASSTLLPSIINTLFLISSRVVKFLPPRYKNAIADELIRVDRLPLVKKDSLSWRLSFIDTFTGFFAFGSLLLILIWWVSHLAPHIGDQLSLFLQSLLQRPG